MTDRRPDPLIDVPLTLLGAPRALRPLDWRWQLARLRVEHRTRRARKLDDPMVRRAVAHLRAVRPRGRRAGYDPAIEAATRLVVGDLRLRQELKARLVAGQGDAEIAARLGRDPEVVGAYAAVHFDVRPMLDATDALMNQAIGPALWERRLDRPGLLKLLGIGMGTLAVDVLSDLLLGPLEGRTSRPVDPHLAETVELLLAMRNLPIDERTAPRIGALHELQQELERARRSESAAAITRPVLSGPDPARRLRAACASIEANPASGADGRSDELARVEAVQGSDGDVAAVARTA